MNPGSTTSSTSETRPVVTRDVLLIGLALALVRLPYFLTRHIQEDAYITWRCAKQFADTGIYGFNPGERVSASTSHLYSFLATVMRLVFRDAFIPLVLVANVLMLVAGVYLLARSLLPERQSRLLWIFAALTPVALMTSYAGMETSLLVFLLGVVIHELTTKDRATLPALLAYGAMPWVRPDAVSILLIIAFAFGLRSRKLILPLAIAGAAGVGLLALFNWSYFGSVLNQTIIAKQLNNHASHKLADVLVRVFGVFFATSHVDSVFVPIRTKYLMKLAPLFALPILAAFVVWTLKAWRESRLTGPALSMVLVALGPPIAFAVGGVIFSWYFWPSVLVAYLLLLAWILDVASNGSSGRRSAIHAALVVVTLLCAAGQWALSVNWGTQERLYRASVGEYLKGISAPGDTLFLEPAGYIPYFSGLKTYDEVGLVAPEVTAYQRKYGPDWYVRFIKEVRPTFIVERNAIVEQHTPTGEPLSDADWAWLKTHYDLVKSFEYRPENLLSNKLLRRLAKMGGSSPYYVFRARPEAKGT